MYYLMVFSILYREDQNGVRTDKLPIFQPLLLIDDLAPKSTFGKCCIVNKYDH